MTKVYVVILDNGDGRTHATVFSQREFADANAAILREETKNFPKARVLQSENILIEHWPMTREEQVGS